jgi:hypothetical protein
MLKPTYSLTIGGLTTMSETPAVGLGALLVERDMDIAADALRLRLMERPGVNLGDEVRLELGHDGDEELVFSGVVAYLQPAITGTSIVALGKMNDLLQLRLSTTYEDQPAGAIARDLIGQAGLEEGAIDDGPTLPYFAIDGRLSTYAHLRGLADRLGYELYSDRAGAVMFHALGDAAVLDAAVGGGLLGAAASAIGSLLGAGGEQYLYGQHLLEATARRRPAPWGTIEVGGESPRSSLGEGTAHWLTVNDADYRGSAGDGEPKQRLLDPAARDKDLAGRFAAGYLAVSRRTAHQVQIRVLGRPQLDLGDSLTTGDVPDDLLNGDGYIRAIRHHFDSVAGFVTHFQVALSGKS